MLLSPGPWAMIDAAASPSSITPYLVWSLVANQAATDRQADLAPSQAAILRCQAAANVLAAAGKTGHKVQVNCRALLHWTSGHEWTDCPLTLTALGSWWKIQHFPCWHSCFGEFSRASWIILRKFHCSNLYLWEQLVLKGICCTRCAGGPPVGSCYSYNICPWKLSSAARSYRQDC